mgnify:CR=1 FL=1
MFYILLAIILKSQVFFSQTDGCLEQILKLIHSAKKEILVSTYTFTSREITNALLEMKDKGISIRIVLDGEQAETKFSKYEYIRKNNLPVRVTHYTKKGFLKPKMHHKFMVVDRSVVLTGSYNFTASAEKINDENCVIIRDEPDVSEKFYKEFERLWKISE